MHPVFCKRLPVGGLGLGNFVFMMRENQILASGMNVDLIPQILFTHDRAFNMPAGTPIAPR